MICVFMKAADCDLYYFLLECSVCGVECFICVGLFVCIRLILPDVDASF